MAASSDLQDLKKIIDSLYEKYNDPETIHTTPDGYIETNISERAMLRAITHMYEFYEAYKDTDIMGSKRISVPLKYTIIYQTRKGKYANEPNIKVELESGCKELCSLYYLIMDIMRKINGKIDLAQKLEIEPIYMQIIFNDKVEYELCETEILNLRDERFEIILFDNLCQYKYKTWSTKI